MAEYIDKSKAISYLNDIRYTYAPMRDDFVFAQKKYEAFTEAIEAIESLPAADVVPVVRCEDCAKREICRTTKIWATPPDDDWDCADGVRTERGNMKSDKLIDPRPLRLKRCCGELPVVHQFSGLGCYGIECRINGHIHNTGFCDSLQRACQIWNDNIAKEEA